MTIAYLVNTYPLPSHSFIRREIRALERLGHDVHRLALRSARASLVDPADREEDAATEHLLEAGAAALAADLARLALAAPGRLLAALRLALACGGRAGSRLRHLVYLAEAARVVRRCRALGVRHLHAHFGTNSAAVAMLAAALGGPRYSVTVHGPEEFDAPLALSLPDKLSRAAFAVAISAHGRSQLCRWVPMAVWPRLHIVPCGVEAAAFPAALPLPEGPLRLVAIGRFAEQKGFAILIEAMAIARRAAPAVTLTLVGDGALRPEIERAIAAAGIGDAVRLAGWLDEAGVRAALAAAHALVIPSFAEGLPVVAMEAMAAGRPVIATWIAGIPELVQDGIAGWLVPPADPQALADAIVAAAAQPLDRLAAMGAAGRERALDRHDVDRAAARLAGLIAAAGGG
ncbi:MAG: glycosyltransferase family 4 protein [Gemmobacter sp.]